MEPSAQLEVKSESQLDTEPTAKILTRLLEDMESLGLIKPFKENSLVGGRVVDKQVEPNTVQTAA